MKLSIIIPVYNMEMYVKKCLETVIAQPSVSKSDFEVIVVNDGSKDKSQDIIDSFDWKGVKHLVLRKKNGGLSDARNYGFLYAQGDYVWFVDSDDWLDEDCIHKILPYFDGADAIHFPRYYRSTDSKEKEVGYNSNGKTGIELTKGKYQYPVQFSIYRTQFLLENDLAFQYGIVMEDLHFTPRALYKAQKIHILDFPVYHYYQREGSIMNAKVSQKRIMDRIWISHDLYKYMVENVSICDRHRWAECIITDINAIMFDAFRSHDKEIINLVRPYIMNEKQLTLLLKYSNNKRNRIWYYLSKLCFNNFFLVYKYLYKLRYKD